MASSKIVVSDMIKPFRGEGDVAAWLKKVELVAKLSKISDLASFIPLYLEGDALAMDFELSDKDQSDADKISEKLKAAFADSPFSAYAKLAQIAWTGESVDVYANAINRLASLAGIGGDGGKMLVKLAFINGFPTEVSVALQRIDKMLDSDLDSLIDHARILTSKQQKGVTVAAVSQSVVKPVAVNPRQDGINRNQFKGQCFRCGGPHMIKDCTEQKPLCFKCGKPGHLANRCWQPTGNE